MFERVLGVSASREMAPWFPVRPCPEVVLVLDESWSPERDDASGLYDVSWRGCDPAAVGSLANAPGCELLDPIPPMPVPVSDAS